MARTALEEPARRATGPSDVQSISGGGGSTWRRWLTLLEIAHFRAVSIGMKGWPPHRLLRCPQDRREGPPQTEAAAIDGQRLALDDGRTLGSPAAVRLSAGTAPGDAPTPLTIRLLGAVVFPKTGENRGFLRRGSRNYERETGVRPHVPSPHLTFMCGRLSLGREAQACLALFPRPALPRGLSCFWKPVAGGACQGADRGEGNRGNPGQSGAVATGASRGASLQSRAPVSSARRCDQRRVGPAREAVPRSSRRRSPR